VLRVRVRVRLRVRVRVRVRVRFLLVQKCLLASTKVHILTTLLPALQRRAAAGEAAAARARDKLQARDLPGAREAMIAAGMYI